MRPIIRLLGFALIATSLNACELLKTDDGVKVVQDSTSVPSGQTAQPAISDTQLQRTYNDMLNNNSNGSVQIFSLDDNDMSAPYVAEAAAPAPAPRLPQGVGKPFGGSNQVTVFSLDDQTTGPDAVGRGAIPPMIDGSMAPMPVGGAPASQDGVSRIYFTHGGKNVNSAGRQVTGYVGQQCRDGGCGVVKVEGHASTRAEAKDEVQRRIVNLKISMDRAMNVMRQLIRDGVPAGAIQVTAHGDRVPPVDVPGGDAEAAARRVEIITGSAY